jgi:YD repeat-containing protein
MKSTTYDMDKNVISASEQEIMNMSVQNSQPSMKSMYEIYAGVQLEVDVAGLLLHLSDPMPYVKQNPLLTQFWALNSMASSVGAGDDGIWMNSDDTIDPLYGYFETKQVGGLYRQITFSDFGVTPSGRTDYVVENNKKVKTYTYTAGDDGEFGTDDDVLTKTTRYTYNAAGKMERAINYSDDETTFQNVFVFSYDGNGRLTGMKSYSDVAETTKLVWGSSSTLTWDDSGETPTLEIKLKLYIDTVLFGKYYLDLMKFTYEFNDDGKIHKMTMYQQLSSTNIDTCYIYVYSESGMLAMGNMNDASDNYSDDGVTQVSHTVNELTISGMGF